jgi:hypothetical protein
MGLNSSDSVSGPIGPSLAQINNITDFLVSNAMPSGPESVKDLLTNMVTFASIFSVALASEAVLPGAPPNTSNAFSLPLAAILTGAMGLEPTSSLVLGAIALITAFAAHLGTFKMKDPTDIPAAHFFSFDVLLNGIISADLIDTFFLSFIASTSGNEAGAKKLAPILTLLMLSLMVLSAVRYGKQNPEVLIQEFAPTIRKGLISLKNIIENASGGDAVSAASVAVDEALQSLDRHDYARLAGALSSFLLREPRQRHRCTARSDPHNNTKLR